MAISVAKRLQPQDRGDRGIPAEDYYVSWNGVSLVVLWKASDPKSDAGFYGGFAAIEILKEALASADALLHVEPCGPHCDYPFAHRDLFVSSSETVADMTTSDRTRFAVTVVTPPEADPLVLVGKLGARVARVSRNFAAMRSYGATVIENDRSARSELATLLGLQYELARAATLPWRESMAARWANRAHGKKMSLVTANLWLRLATIEDNLRHWRDSKAAFDGGIQDGTDLIFAHEYADGATTLDAIDVEDLRAAVDRMSQRADARTVTAATIGGAIAGGAVGGIIALVASVASGGAT
jgi:hypothetical protein